MQEFDINIFANSSQAFCIVRVDLDEGGKPFSYTPVFFNQALMNLVRVEEGRTIEEQCPMLFQNMNPRCLRLSLSYNCIGPANRLLPLRFASTQ